MRNQRWFAIALDSVEKVNIAPLLRTIDSLAKYMTIVGRKSVLQVWELTGLRKVVGAAKELHAHNRR